MPYGNLMGGMGGTDPSMLQNIRQQFGNLFNRSSDMGNMNAGGIGSINPMLGGRGGPMREGGIKGLAGGGGGPMWGGGGGMNPMMLQGAMQRGPMGGGGPMGGVGIGKGPMQVLQGGMGGGGMMGGGGGALASMMQQAPQPQNRPGMMHPGNRRAREQY